MSHYQKPTVIDKHSCHSSVLVKIILFFRAEDENSNSLVQNVDEVDITGEEKLGGQDKATNLTDFRLSIEERLALIERDVELNNATDESHKIHQINMNICKLTGEEAIQSNALERIKTQEIAPVKGFLNNMKEEMEHLENGNKYSNICHVSVNGHSEEVPHFAGKSELKRSATVDTDSSSEMCLSKSTEDLSPQRSGTVVKSHSITNMEAGALKIYDISDNASQHPNPAAKSIVPVPDGKNIVRSKSATLLYDQPLQVFSSSSSSDLICTKTVYKFDSNHNPEGPNVIRGQGTNASQLISTPQYNVQYSSSMAAKESLWPQKQNSLVESSCLPPQRLQRADTTENCSSVKHSANMNFSNHNNVRASAAYNMHQRMGGRHMEMWAVPPNDRLVSGATRNTLQRQSSVSSTASMNVGDTGPPRRAQIPEGDYLTYRDLHGVGRVPPIMSGPQRPLSARTYSVDGPNVPRPQSARPSANEIPERTMSVSDFNYSRTSPSKRTNPRVNSEHSLLDPPGKTRVPHDWREQVLRHIEAKKLEKVNAFTVSFNFFIIVLIESIKVQLLQLCMFYIVIVWFKIYNEKYKQPHIFSV